MLGKSAVELKVQHRACRDAQPEYLRVRIHRAISWLARAEAEGEDQDARFIFLWVAFNAAYANEFGFEQSERAQVKQFVGRLVTVDDERQLHKALFEQFTGPVRTLIENKYVFEPFWKALRDHDASDQWEKQFAASRRVALKALMENDTEVLMSVVLDRLYVLRNQLVHGGATWNGTTNRAQLKDGAQILGSLVPNIIDLMMKERDIEWGSIAYPVV